jgi:hypothetical protein
VHVIISHLGLGDAILQAGLAVVLAKRYGRIAFPCYHQYLPSVRSFFVNHPEIVVYPVEHHNAWGSPPDWAYDKAIAEAGLAPALDERIRLGVYHGTGIHWDFSQDFYDHAGVDYAHRWESCPIAAASEQVEQLDWKEPDAENIFLHDDPARGFTITRLVRYLAYAPNLREADQSILRYATLIRTAKTVAVIDSSFLHLSDCFTLYGDAQLHCYARWVRPRDFRYQSQNQWRYLF